MNASRILQEIAPVRSARSVTAGTLAAILWAFSHPIAGAATFEWAAAVDGNFDEAARWNLLIGSGGGFPVAGDLAIFNEVGTYEVGFTGQQASGFVDLGAGDVTFWGSGGAAYTITGGSERVDIRTGTLTLGRNGEPLPLIVGDDLDITNNGTLNVRHGSLLDVSGGVTVGLTSGTTSRLLVEGADSVINFADRLNLGGSGASGTLILQDDATGTIAGSVGVAASLGNNVTGSLQVLSGATLETGSIQVAAGLLVGSNLSGEIVVDGRDSELTMSGASTLAVGRGGQSGSVMITDEAELTTGTGLTTIGNGGSMTVDGSDGFSTFSTVLDVNGGLQIDSGGTLNLIQGWLRVTGDLDNTAGGTLNLDHGQIQVAAGAFRPSQDVYTIESQTIDESLTITIANGASWTDASIIRVGGSNEGILSISGTGAVTTSDLRIRNNGKLFMGFDAQLSTESARIEAGGTASVGGSVFDGATWTNTGTLSVSGQLTVKDAGVVDTNLVSLSGSGALILDGGTVIANAFSNSADAFDFRKGTLVFNTDLSIGATSSAFPHGLDLHTLQEVISPVTVQVRRGVPLVLNGGTLRANSLDVDGTFRFYSGVLELTGGPLSGVSQLNVPANGEFRATGDYSIPLLGVPGSAITATGDLTLGDASSVVGFGTAGNLQVGEHAVTLLDANDVVFDSLALMTLGRFSQPGTLNAANGLTLNFGGNISGFGTLDTPDDPARPLLNNGHITGAAPDRPLTLTGYVKGVGTCDNCEITGTDAPGLSPATVYRGSVQYRGVLELEVGGTTAGSQFDQLRHALGAGIADLGGMLELKLIDGFVPAAVDSFEVLTALSLLGEFENVAGGMRLETAGGEGSFVVQYDYAAKRVVLGDFLAAQQFASDFDKDGDVDGQDFLIWQTGFPTLDGTATSNTGDANGDGNIDGQDFLVWQGEFGSGLRGSERAAVPEPAVATALILALAGCLVRQRGVGRE